MDIPSLPDPPQPLWDLYIPHVGRRADGNALDPFLGAIEADSYLLCLTHHKEMMAGITFQNFQQALGYLEPQTYLAFMKGWEPMQSLITMKKIFSTSW